MAAGRRLPLTAKPLFSSSPLRHTTATQLTPAESRQISDHVRPSLSRLALGLVSPVGLLRFVPALDPQPLLQRCAVHLVVPQQQHDGQDRYKSETSLRIVLCSASPSPSLAIYGSPRARNSRDPPACTVVVSRESYVRLATAVALGIRPSFASKAARRAAVSELLRAVLVRVRCEKKQARQGS